MNNDYEILTKTLYFEGGSTLDLINIDTELKYIAWIIRNRVEGKRRFGKTYTEVCLKKWQFSCWNGKTLDQIKKISWNGKSWRWRVCKYIASYVMEAPGKSNPIPGCCHYYEPTLCCPSWARKKKRVYPEQKLKHLFFWR